MAVFMPNEYIHDWSKFETENLVLVTAPYDINVGYSYLDVNVTVDLPHYSPRSKIISKTQLASNSFRYAVFFTIASIFFDYKKYSNDKEFMASFENGMTITINDGQATYRISPDYPISVIELAPEFRPVF